MFKRISNILNNEDASPSIEALGALVTGIAIIASIIGLGIVLIKFVGGALSRVPSLNT